MQPFKEKGQTKELCTPVHDSAAVGTNATKMKEKGQDDTIAELLERITELELDLVVKEQTNQSLEGQVEYLKGNVKKLEGEVDNLTDNVSKLEGELQHKIDENDELIHIKLQLIEELEARKKGDPHSPYQAIVLADDIPSHNEALARRRAKRKTKLVKNLLNSKEELEEKHRVRKRKKFADCLYDQHLKRSAMKSTQPEEEVNEVEKDEENKEDEEKKEEDDENDGNHES